VPRKPIARHSSTGVSSAPNALSTTTLQNRLVRLTLSASRDDALLQKYGLKANDAILAEEKHMGLYEDLMARDARLIAGGAAQNTARGAQVRHEYHHTYTHTQIIP